MTRLESTSVLFMRVLPFSVNMSLYWKEISRRFYSVSDERIFTRLTAASFYHAYNKEEVQLHRVFKNKEKRKFREILLQQGGANNNLTDFVLLRGNAEYYLFDYPLSQLPEQLFSSVTC